MKAVTDAIHIGDSLFCVNREAQLDTFNEKLGMNVPNHIAIILDGNGKCGRIYAGDHSVIGLINMGGKANGKLFLEY